MRDREHQPTLDAGRLKEAVDGVREATDLVVQLSTGGAVTDPLDQRLTVLDADPDSCSLTCGTTNFGDGVFLNPWGFMVDLYRQAQEREVVPEFELFELGHVHALRRLIDECGLPYGGKVHVDFVTGVPGGMPGTPQALLAGVAMLPPEVTSWSATGIGRAHLPIVAAALSAGGHLRVGMEDNLMYRQGPAGRAQRRARGPGRRARDGDAAAADVDDRGARGARDQGPPHPLTREPRRFAARPAMLHFRRPVGWWGGVGRLTLPRVCILLAAVSTMEA